MAASAARNGTLNVQSDQAGLKVYLDGEAVGATPLVNYPLEPGEHWVSIFNPDSVRRQYDVITSGGPGDKLGTLWYLAKVEKGTARINLAAGETKSLFLSLKQAEQASCAAKWKAGACLSAPFLFGILLGVVITLLAHGG
jgi:hypothetical protein